MSTGEGKVFKLYAYFTHSKSSTRIECSSFEVTTNQLPSLASMGSMNNVRNRAYLGKNRYSSKIWKSFVDCFNCMPVAALIEEKILCMHGGLSPDLISA